MIAMVHGFVKPQNTKSAILSPGPDFFRPAPLVLPQSSLPGLSWLMVTIISLGGSIVAPDSPDISFIKDFHQRICQWLETHPQERLVFIVGGGGPARTYQGAYRQVLAKPDANAQDWIGIMATRLNAELIRAIFEQYCSDPVVTDPSASIDFKGRILVAAGWKPGFSTDFDAVWLAGRFGAKTVLNLSNVAKVYTDDPRKNPEAKPLDRISWEDFRSMVGDTWEPGKNVPFDPIASQKAQELGLSVICAAGKDLDNLMDILNHQNFTGTTIG